MDSQDSTTPPGVPDSADNTPNPPAAPVKTARELAMEAIESRHQQQQAAENGIELDMSDSDDADEQLAAQLAPVQTAPAAPPQTLRVKVDGIEADVPIDEVVRNYQKGASADRKLAEAARVQREAAEFQAQVLEQQRQLAAQQQQWSQQQQATPPNSSDPSGHAPTDTDKQFLKALFEGDEETALARLSELTRSRATPQQVAPDMEQITNAVTAQIQQKLHVDSALAQHQKDYPEIYADSDMEAFVLTKVGSVRQSSGSDFFTALNQVSGELASKFGWAQASGRSESAAPTTNPRVAKLERKASIDNLSSVNTKTSTNEPVPDSPSDIIAEMRRGRLAG